MVQGKINRGRHTDHPAGRHSIRTNQCPSPPSSHIFFTGQMPFLPPNQQCQSTEGNWRIRMREKTLEFSSAVLPAPSPYRICHFNWSRRYISGAATVTFVFAPLIHLQHTTPFKRVNVTIFHKIDKVNITYVTQVDTDVSQIWTWVAVLNLTDAVRCFM